ncbi:MAG: fatty acid desaturase [Alphaproteobacteria bacterium]|nr:fatty acid desaturase [Alphaproteobacteria bacterium]
MASKRARWVRDAIVAGNDFHAMKMDPTRHNLINLGSTAGLIGAFAGLVALANVLPLAAYLPLAAIGFGVLYFSVNVLIIHECSHNMFLLSKDREQAKRWNHVVGVIAGILFFTDYVRHWEKGHTVHHLRPCEPDDPQDRDPKTGARLYKLYAGLLLIPGFFMALNPSRQYDGQLKRALMGAVAWSPIIALAWWVAGWAAPLAIALGFHVVMMLNMSKKAQEHGCGLADEPDPYLRSRTYFYPLSFLFSPFNINYHFEHHANFNVPWYKLPAYHRALMEIVPEPVKPYYFHHDYLLQLSGKKPLPPDALRPMLVAEATSAK